MRKIVQVAIICRDVQACANRWAALMGVQSPRVGMTRPGSEVNLIYRGKPSNGQIKVAYFALDNGPALELMEPVGGDTAWKEHLDEHGETVHHIAFQVEDVERTLKTMESLGYPVLHRGRLARTDAKKNGDYVYLDTVKQLGVVIELLHNDPPKP
jgi:catechol 2,3-dioxygenase-like lactoylglutathione lyase family enzyme